MAISSNRYVQITSEVAGVAEVAARELILRVFTENSLVPTGSVVEFTNLADVETYFGSSSTEYQRAAQYFGYIGKQNASPQKISFAHWANVATDPLIFGVVGTYAIGTFTPISTGSLKLTMGAYTYTMTGINLTGAGSLAAVATDITTAINAESGGGALWTGAVVAYDATNKRFTLVGGATGDAVISVSAPASGVDLSPLIGWTDSAIYSDGSDVQTITDCLTSSSDLSNNFGSYVFVPTLTSDQIVESATWNMAQNVAYQYCVATSSSNAATISPLIIGYSGTGLVLDPAVSNEYPDQCAAQILASTDYTRPNAAANYMYQKFPTLTSSVTSNTDADTYDALRVNYIGKTQSAGQTLAFFQRGFLMGGSDTPQDMGVYANEQWFKDACSVAVFNLLLSQNQVPANSTGVGMVLSSLQSIIQLALTNGTIEVGKTLTSAQINAITTITADPNAWKAVQSIGYVVYGEVVPYVVNSITQYKINYTIVYSKGDSIRKVVGLDVLI